MPDVRDYELHYIDRRGFPHKVSVIVDAKNDEQLRGHLIALVIKHERLSHDQAVRRIADFFMDVHLPYSTVIVRQFRAAK